MNLLECLRHCPNYPGLLVHKETKAIYRTDVDSGLEEAKYIQLKRGEQFIALNGELINCERIRKDVE
jgi:hypothetical protein